MKVKLDLTSYNSLASETILPIFSKGDLTVSVGKDEKGLYLELEFLEKVVNKNRITSMTNHEYMEVARKLSEYDELKQQVNYLLSLVLENKLKGLGQ